jgi:hypothetical protein
MTAGKINNNNYKKNYYYFFLKKITNSGFGRFCPNRPEFVMDGLSQTVWNSGQFGPHCLESEFPTHFSRQFKTVQNKPSRTNSRRFFAIYGWFETI